MANVSSKRLHKRMHNHTGCICLTFLHCAFSNELSKRLHGRMHNHTGCICLIFPHCVFSNASSNGLLDGMHSHTGCICVSFHHCVFLNVCFDVSFLYVYSNYLHQKRQNHTDGIYLTFLCCAFSNAS